MKQTNQRRLHTRALWLVLWIITGGSAALAGASDHELLCEAAPAAGSFERTGLPLDGESSEEALRRALTRLASSHPAGHWRLAEVESRLGGVLAARGRLEEAEPMLRRGYVTLQTQCSALDPRTRQALGRLADFYRAQASEEALVTADDGSWAVVAEARGAEPAAEAP